MTNQILNSTEAIPESQTLAVQVAPFGEFKGVLHMKNGKTKPVVQHLDAAAFERVLNAWTKAGSPELLVDADHVSCDGGRS